MIARQAGLAITVSLLVCLALPGAARAGDSRDDYDRAFTALVAGDFDTAIAWFDAVASESDDVDLIAASRELARLAADLRDRGVRFSNDSPSATPVVDDGGEDRDDSTKGRTSFITTTTMTSFYSGFVLIDLLDIDDFRPGVAIVAGTTGLGLVGSIYATRGRTITEATADAYGIGLGIGVGNGLLLASPLGLDNETENIQMFALGSMVLGGAAGLYLGDQVNPTRAQVSVTGTMGMMGLATVGLGFGIVQPDDIGEDTVLILLAAGLDVGVLGGLAMAPKLDWSVSRARLVTLGAFVGAVAGFAGAAIITGAEDPDDETGRLWSASILGGAWGGLGLAWHLTRDMDPDPRYRAESSRTTSIAPTLIRDAPGFAVAGTF